MSGLYKKILVVEDDSMLRNLIIENLRNRFQVISAPDGEEGIKQIQTQQPDLVVLDLLLPKMGGFDLLKQLRELPHEALANIPVVILSNLNDQESIKKAQSYKIADYFMKGDITLGFMANRISNILA